MFSRLLKLVGADHCVWDVVLPQINQSFLERKTHQSNDHGKNEREKANAAADYTYIYADYTARVLFLVISPEAQLKNSTFTVWEAEF